mgnify:CR=1 FL=1
MADEFELNGITEGDFQSWKHHPVSKLFFRYLRDFVGQARRDQLIAIENSKEAMSPKEQGEYKGAIKVLTELAEIEFSHLLALYPVEEKIDADEEEPDAA